MCIYTCIFFFFLALHCVSLAESSLWHTGSVVDAWVLATPWRVGYYSPDQR